MTIKHTLSMTGKWVVANGEFDRYEYTIFRYRRVTKIKAIDKYDGEELIIRNIKETDNMLVCFTFEQSTGRISKHVMSKELYADWTVNSSYIVKETWRKLQAHGPNPLCGIWENENQYIATLQLIIIQQKDKYLVQLREKETNIDLTITDVVWNGCTLRFNSKYVATGRVCKVTISILSAYKITYRYRFDITEIWHKKDREKL